MIFKKFRSSLLFRSVEHKEGEAILDVSALSAAYNGNRALENVTFRLNQGERVAVVGPNGAGKSTLFKVIAGAMEASEGDVKVFGFKPGEHICIAFVPQRSLVDLSFPATVADVVMMGRAGKIGLLRWPRKLDWAKVAESLELVGLTDLKDRQIGELSGGQQQRMFIAQALAQEADLILMDEPLTGLDGPSQEKILQILKELQQRRITVMVATHDLALARSSFDRVMLLNRRMLAFAEPEAALGPDQLIAAYGNHMHVLPGETGTLLMIEDECHDC